ncbi:MAG: hypothetical protein K9N51_01960, partial [Candidatus Pacebacteria bacterium]|nr:hypothetical protein [Candidatus Paceibacterota bacterium]
LGEVPKPSSIMAGGEIWEQNLRIDTNGIELFGGWVGANYPHGGKMNALFCDGHAEGRVCPLPPAGPVRPSNREPWGWVR